MPSNPIEYTYESVNCNICESNNVDLITKDNNYDYSLKLVLCRNCGLGYLNPRWTAEDYKRFYKSKYDDSYRPEITEDFQLKEIRSFPLIKRLKKSNLLPKEVNNILDIGCGAGDLLMSLSALYSDSQLHGIEPSLNAQKILVKRNVKMLATDVNDDWQKSNTDKFDLIIMRHVLEHFLDPKSVLKKVKRTLTENGILYIAVPNNLNPVHHLRSKWFRVVHTYYFNRFSLRNLLQKSGFEILALVEMDDLGPGELYAVVKRTNTPSQPDLSSGHYEIQKQIFLNCEIRDKKLKNRIKHFIRKIIAQILELIMSLKRSLKKSSS